MQRTCRSLLFVTLAVAAVGCVEQTPDGPSEDDIKAAKEHILSAAPTPKYPINAELDDKLVYLGLDVDTDTVTPGKAFTLTHYWKVLKPVGDDWKLFIHLEAPDSKRSHLNADHVPINGKYPLSAWKAGDIIRDIHRVSVPPTWPANTVEIYVGLWKGPVRMSVKKGPKDSENRVLVVKLPISGQKEVDRKRLIARKIKNGAIKVDGKLDEKEWKDAASTGVFVRTMDGQPVDQKTEAKVLWDDKTLYVAFDVEDKDIWTTLDKRDEKLYSQEAVEVFIDADGDGKTYVELQTNPKGAIFDSYLPSYRANKNEWDSGMKVGVKVDGTIEKRGDLDRGWTVEMAIPLTDAKGMEKEMKNVPPIVGTEWRVNFYRLDMPQGKSQIGSAWSPPGVSDFHALDKFGVLVFGDDKGVAPNQPKKVEPTAQDESPPPPKPVAATRDGGFRERPKILMKARNYSTEGQ